MVRESKTIVTNGSTEDGKVSKKKEKSVSIEEEEDDDIDVIQDSGQKCKEPDIQEKQLQSQQEDEDQGEEKQKIGITDGGINLFGQTPVLSVPTFTLPPTTFGTIGTETPTTTAIATAPTPLIPVTPSIFNSSPFVFSGFAGFPTFSLSSNAIDVSALPSNANNNANNNQNNKNEKKKNEKDSSNDNDDENNENQDKDGTADDDRIIKQTPCKGEKGEEQEEEEEESVKKTCLSKCDIPVATPHNTTTISFSNLRSLSAKKKTSQSPLPPSLIPQISAFSSVSQGTYFYYFFFFFFVFLRYKISILVAFFCLFFRILVVVKHRLRIFGC